MNTVHRVIAYFSDGSVEREPWRVQSSPLSGHHRDGPATDEGLRAWCEAWSDPDRAIERAVIVRPGPVVSDGFQFHSERVVATYIRSTQPTNDQTRLIERIGSRPGVTAIMCDPQANGDVQIRVTRSANRGYSDTTIKRHPTLKELIYDDHTDLR